MSKPLDAALNNILTSAQLPTLPAVAARLLELTAREDAAFAEIVDCIVRDVALSAKLLKVANSPLYGFRQRITTVNQAVTLLGINAVRNLVLSFSFLALGEKRQHSLFNLELFWERSLVSGMAAKLIAGLLSPQIDPDELFTVGLLQDVGQLVFAFTMPARYDHVLEQLAVGDGEVTEAAVEEEYLALAHTTAGYEVARAWGLPATILAGIRHHHNPDGCPVEPAHEQLIARIAYLADLVTRIYYSCVPERHYRHLQVEAERLLGLDGLAIRQAMARIHRDLYRAAQTFDIGMEPKRPVEEIIREANIRLGLLHLSYEEVHRQLTLAKQELEAVRLQLTERNRQLEKLANIDGLTEIHNHRFFQHFLYAEINRSIKNQSDLSLLLADIDHFKQFNDTHGHQTGDFILKELCVVATSVIREYDLMARYGGEEFAFVLPDTPAEAALKVARRVCLAIADHDFFDGRCHYRVTISIGVACGSSLAGDFNQNNLIGEADQALYLAKCRGRNRVVLHEGILRTKRLAA